MAYLFVDTSHLLHLGLLSEDFTWIESEVVETKKTSEVLHEKVHTLLEKHNFSTSNLKGLITIAGPGSYTGMRVGEGFAQVFELENIPVYSFYSSDIPEILNASDASWVFPAFKREYYIRTAKEEKLLSEEDFEEFCLNIADKSLLYTHGENELSSRCGRNTRSLLINEPKVIFSEVVSSKIRKRPYYFRPLHVEFKKS